MSNGIRMELGPSFQIEMLKDAISEIGDGIVRAQQVIARLQSGGMLVYNGVGLDELESKLSYNRLETGSKKNQTT